MEGGERGRTGWTDGRADGRTDEGFDWTGGQANELKGADMWTSEQGQIMGEQADRRTRAGRRADGRMGGQDGR